MLKDANGRGLSAESEAMRLRSLAVRAAKEAYLSELALDQDGAIRSIQISQMLRDEAEAVEREAAL